MARLTMRSLLLATGHTLCTPLLLPGTANTALLVHPALFPLGNEPALAPIGL